MKKNYLLILILLTQSCGLEYDGETKLTIQGQLVDASNNPISNVYIETFIYSGESSNESSFIFPSFSDQDVISYTKTDALGNFKMTFPKPNNGTINLFINNNDSYNSNDQTIITLQKKTFYGVKNDNFKNYMFDIGKQTMYLTSEIATLTITLNKVTNNLSLIDNKFEIVGSQSNKDVFLDDTVNYYGNYFYENTTTIEIIKNQIIIVKFKVFNTLTNQTEEFQTNITITNANEQTHTIDY